MKKKMLFALLLLLTQYAFAGCKTIPEGKYFTLSMRTTGSACYQYYVASGNMPVFTLKNKKGQADFDLAIYNDSEFSKRIGLSEYSGTASELLTLATEDYNKYFYIIVTNASNNSGTYELYAKQIDFANQFGEVFAETMVDYAIEWSLKALLGIDQDSSASTQQNAARTSAAISSMLQGKTLAGTSRDLLIDEIKRSTVGDGFISDFTVNYAISIIDEIYEYY
ncbi:hypothetical protein PN36_15095 [Candidatus Thiomargarita nelsonii]|uniref:Secreted protein n=1 Tax=Candidatus Thiomargarita nelsonii TaxID=1003181 RepID=A0A0A6P3U2_9GAMM|nr:hypothetical protein PN36_15095 [Candidatus Thiomargarita nelsonii]